MYKSATSGQSSHVEEGRSTVLIDKKLLGYALTHLHPGDHSPTTPSSLFVKRCINELRTGLPHMFMQRNFPFFRLML